MEKVNDSAMVALLPTTSEWCKIDLPHLTVVYLGKVSDLDPLLFGELSKTVSNLSVLTKTLKLKVSGIEVFGEEEKVDVLRLIPSQELLSIRYFLQDWDNGDFPEYKPHATIGPSGEKHENHPIFLTFDRLLVQWEDESVVFQLRQN